MVKLGSFVACISKSVLSGCFLSCRRIDCKLFIIEILFIKVVLLDCEDFENGAFVLDIF